MRLLLILPLAAACATANLAAQDSQNQSAQPSIATVPIEGVSLSGSLSVAGGRAVIGNDGSITAGDKTARVSLTRGGSLNVCASTKVQLSADKNTPGGALMIAIDRGAFEAHYTPGQYSDVILTPDLRILISGPGQADLSLRVMPQGDTCVDNHGKNAPYVLASSLFSGGAYRIQPNQRVLFEHGSLNEVVDNEQDPCGCPTSQPLSVASTGIKGGKKARPGQKVAEAENPFPLAESEGFQSPPPLPKEPAVPPGETHTEVEAPLTYNSSEAEPPPAAPASASESGGRSAPTAQAPQPARPHRGFFRSIGHFFHRIFRGK